MKTLNYRRDVKCGLCHADGVVARMTISSIGNWGQVTKQLTHTNLCNGCLRSMATAMAEQEAKQSPLIRS